MITVGIALKFFKKMLFFSSISIFSRANSFHRSGRVLARYILHVAPGQSPAEVLGQISRW